MALNDDYINQKLTITLTTGTLPLQIAEARDKLDSWLAKFSAPSKYHTLDLKLARYSGRSLTYAVSWRQMDGPEYKQAHIAEKNGDV